MIITNYEIIEKLAEAPQAAISLENARLVDEMMKAEERIRKSLHEKEELLRELRGAASVRPADRMLEEDEEVL